MVKRVSGSILCTGIIDGKDGKDGQNGQDGQNGSAGRDAAVLEFTGGNPAPFRTDADGVTVGAQEKTVTLRIRTAGGTATPTKANITVVSQYYDITITKPSNGQIKLSIPADKTLYEGTISVTAVATIGGVSYTASGGIIVVCNRTGLRGDAGPWIYYDGQWDAAKQYNKSAGTPYVKAADGLKYILSAANSQNQDPRSFNNGNPWELMTMSFKYLVADMVFSENAQFGSFVFNRDWLISTSGSIGGTRYLSIDRDSPASVTVSGNSVPAYTRFNPSLPDGKMKVPLSSQAIVSSELTDNAYFDLLGGHTYYIAVTIGNRSSASTSRTIDIYLREVGSSANLKTMTVDHNGRFILGPYAPSSDKSVRICCVSTTNLTASVTAVMVTSNTVFIPNFAVDGLSGKSYQNDAYVSGEVTANRLLAADATFSTEITPGLVEFRSILEPLSYLRIGADSDGMVFQMTDKYGRLIWNLGGASQGIGSITSGGGDYTTVYYKKMSGQDPAVSEFSYVTRDDCTAYYRYNGQWASANGQRVFAEGEEAKNGIVHKTQVSGTTQSLIDDGYYVVPNNGNFMMQAPVVEDGSGDQQKVVSIYHFVSGKITETIRKEFY